jgi:hypothetical protein
MVARDNVELKTEIGGSDDDLWEERLKSLQPGRSQCLGIADM